MKKVKWLFLLFAIAAAACMMGTGIAIGQRNAPGIFITLFCLILVMGFGFSLKKKMRESGKL
ncbi:YlaF family protein [Bacillus massilinigeriensis]|uniref:YlaF family protein n=1 Tax=Bacillus massilionigeriensis TaxID=1805475 RepID=UPI00096B343C|nr:YlaF family protein [Bacillus massilionigeriensis]